ncbi:MAG: outer membrane protein [Bacteroidetes bacterium]|nr:MAG: outer membrane protein [Bacteroidota bacterium]
MKKLFVTTLLALLISGGQAFAQKFAWVDTDYIMAQIPEYKQAQDELNKLSVQWQKEIEAKYAEIDKLYKNFQQDQLLLTEDLRKKREAEIVEKEKDAKDLQKQRFGVDGDLFKKRQELVKPIQDKVFNAVKELAELKSYACVFDKSSDLTMLYTNAKYDMSEEVLEKMGYKKTGN